MRRVAWVLAACFLGAGAATAADREFSDVVRALSDEWHAKPRHVPLFGLVNLVAGTMHPAGAKHIELAIFDDVRYSRSEGRSMAQCVRDAVGANWAPFVHARSVTDRKTVLVYARAAGRDWKLLVVAMDHTQATVVELLLDMDALARWMQDPENSAWHWSGVE